MKIHVRYFAGAREAAGCEGETLQLGTGGDVSALLALLTARHPDLAQLAPRLRFAIGTAFRGTDARLAEGDEVALIPPVGGG